MLKKFWLRRGTATLILLAVLSLVAAGVYGQVSHHSDVEPEMTGVEPYLPEALTLKQSKWLGWLYLPKLYDWGGGVPIQWSYSWQTGKDNDLICIKAILIRIDTNITTMLEG